MSVSLLEGRRAHGGDGGGIFGENVLLSGITMVMMQLNLTQHQRTVRDHSGHETDAPVLVSRRSIHENCIERVLSGS